MHLLVAEDYDELSWMAARQVADALRANPLASLAVPTGATPAGFYRELAALHRREVFDTSRLRVFQLDEYLGVAPDDPRSFANWITSAFLDPLDIAARQVTWLPGDTADPAAACAAYDEGLRATGGLDLLVLGLGENGHVGFNEPPADPDAPTRVVQLTDATRVANATYWGSAGAVPLRALTCGMANLLAAKMKIVLVSGEHKRDILRRTIAGPVTPDVPASFLQRVSGVTIVADRAAAPPTPGPTPSPDSVSDSG